MWAEPALFFMKEGHSRAQPGTAKLGEGAQAGLFSQTREMHSFWVRSIPQAYLLIG